MTVGQLVAILNEFEEGLEVQNQQDGSAVQFVALEAQQEGNEISYQVSIN